MRYGNKEFQPFCLEIIDQNKKLKELNTEKQRIENEDNVKVQIQNDSDDQSKPIVTEMSE